MPNDTFKALSDPTRRRILLSLKTGRKPAGEIAAQFDLSAATVSHHLSILKGAELVFEAKQKNYVFYELNLSVFEEAILWLTQFKEATDHEEEN